MSLHEMEPSSVSGEAGSFPVTNGSLVTVTSSSSVHVSPSSSSAIAASTTAPMPDNPTATGFDTGPSFSEARKAFLNRANTSQNAASEPSASFRKQSSTQPRNPNSSNRNSAIFNATTTTTETTSANPATAVVSSVNLTSSTKGSGQVLPPTAASVNIVTMGVTTSLNSLSGSSIAGGTGNNVFVQQQNHWMSSGGSIDPAELTSALQSKNKSEALSDNNSFRKQPISSSSENTSGSMTSSYAMKRGGDLYESSLNSDTDSIAPQSSVYSADLKGSQMTINSEFSVNSTVNNTPVHQGLNPANHGRFLKSQSAKNNGATEVGLRELTNQIRRKFVRNGFRLNLMVVGETGLGKSTFVNTLFHSTVYGSNTAADSSGNQKQANTDYVINPSSDRWKNEISKFQKSETAAGKQHKTSLSSRPTSLATALKLNTTTANTSSASSSSSASEPSPSGGCKVPQWSVDETQCSMNEGDVSLVLGLIDTPGFAQCLNNSECAEPLVNYINKQFDKFMTIESQVDRCENKENKTSSQKSASSANSQSNSSKKVLSTKLSNDPRVHCCLYFLSPQNPHRLKAVDVQTMKSLGDKVNLIPLIAKADTLTAEELKDYKQMVNQQIAANDIKVFDIPDLTPEQQQSDPEMNRENKKLKGMVPFAVCGSTSVNASGVRVREYPFGQVEIENPLHCDFVALRTVLMEMHTWNLVEITEHNHYEKYRSLKLASSIGSTSAASTPTPSGGSTMATSLGVSTANVPAGKDSFYSKTPGSTSSNKNPLAILGEERKAHEERLTKMQADMQSVFEQKVAEKERRLKMKEEEMMKKHDEMRRNLEAQQAALGAARDQHERNLQAWTESTAAASVPANHNTATLPAGYGGAGDVNDSAMATSKDKKKKLFGR